MTDPLIDRNPYDSGAVLTVTSPNGNWLVDSIQLKNRKLVPKWFGDFILWALFDKTSTQTSVTISGFSR